MRLMVSAGATGGGVNPALAVLQEIDKDQHQILWVGSQGGIEADLVTRAGIAFSSVPAAGIHGVGLRIVGNTIKLLKGYFAARKLIQDFQPDVLFFTGGYVAVPTGLAGLKVPTLLCLPDIEPGLAIRALASFADVITIPAEASRNYFSTKKQIVHTGYPVRSSLSQWEKAKARDVFQLTDDRPTLLVTGGSLGARSINQSLLKALPELLKSIQVIHITGQLNWAEVQEASKALPPQLLSYYHPYAYLHEDMGAAYSVADLVVSRAGASILGEYTNFELPSILVPYPHAWRYQKINADHLVQHGAALLLKDEDLDEELFVSVQTLISQPEKLEAMKAALRSLAHPTAAKEIARLLLQLASTSKGSA